MYASLPSGRPDQADAPTRLIDQSPITTQVPSTAERFDYAAAGRGWSNDCGTRTTPRRIVCAVRGLQATTQDIFDAESARDAQPTQNTK